MIRVTLEDGSLDFDRSELGMQYYKTLLPTENICSSHSSSLLPFPFIFNSFFSGPGVHNIFAYFYSLLTVSKSTMLSFSNAVLFATIFVGSVQAVPVQLGKRIDQTISASTTAWEQACV